MSDVPILRLHQPASRGKVVRGVNKMDHEAEISGQICQIVHRELYAQVDELQHHCWTGTWDDG